MHVLHRDRRGAVLFADDEEHRPRHARDLRIVVVVGERRAAADIAGKRRSADHLAQRLEMRRVFCHRLGRKPARDRRVDGRFHALRLRDGDAFLPLLGGDRRRHAGRVAHDDAIDAIRVQLGEAERGRAAHREAREVRAPNRERVEQPDGVGDERIEGIAASRRIGPAMAALIVAHHAVLRLERRRLLVPHGARGAERVGEDDARRPFGALDRAAHVDAVRLDAHGSTCVMETKSILSFFVGWVERQRDPTSQSRCSRCWVSQDLDPTYRLPIRAGMGYPFLGVR